MSRLLLWWPRVRSDRGSGAIEAAVLAPPLLLLIGLAIVGGRIQVAGWAIEAAAHDAARAASIARTEADARVRALAAANATLQQDGLHCARLDIELDTSGFAVPVGLPATVTATLTCVVDFSDLVADGLPGSRTLTATFTSSLDTFRSRALGFANSGASSATNPSDRSFVAADAGVQMHVVAAVGMDGIAAFGAFQLESGFDGDAAGGVVAGRVAQVQAVEAGLAERPGADGCQRAGSHACSTGGGEHPVATPCDAVIEIQACQGDASEHPIAAVGYRPARAFFLFPALAVSLEPVLHLGLGCGLAGVPVLDRRVLVGGEEDRRVGRLPGAQDDAARCGKDGLRACGEGSGRDGGRGGQRRSHDLILPSARGAGGGR